MSDFETKIFEATREAVKAVWDIEPEEGSYVVETPQNPDFGDYSTNVAMKLSRTLRRNPMDIAAPIVQELERLLPEADSVTVARPGFINFKLKQDALSGLIDKVIAAGEDYGRNDSGRGKRVLVEWVSANPTGRLHCGHARNAAWGDCICRLMEASGYEVLREYYVNDAGNQIVMLGKSISARYFEHFGRGGECPMPEEGYHAEDIRARLEDGGFHHITLYMLDTLFVFDRGIEILFGTDRQGLIIAASLAVNNIDARAKAHHLVHNLVFEADNHRHRHNHNRHTERHCRHSDLHHRRRHTFIIRLARNPAGYKPF